MICRHCSEPKTLFARRLCVRCYRTPGVKELYSSASADYHEPTEEELDAMIAEQMRNLPDWWDRESRALRDAQESP